MCRGPTHTSEGPRSKLARVTPPAVPSQRCAHESRRGATAAEAVDLSDDDDDVVIIEENMQPQGHKPPAAAKQPGGSAAAFCANRCKDNRTHLIMTAVYADNI